MFLKLYNFERKKEIGKGIERIFHSGIKTWNISTSQYNKSTGTT